MCEFFSFVTDPENHGGKRFYFDWEYRKQHLERENDSHSTICYHYELKEDKCNKYEYNPLTKKLKVDQINSTVDDRVQIENWVVGLDFKKVVKPLIIKPIVNPLLLPKVTQITNEHILLLKEWNSVCDSVLDSVRDSVRGSVGDSVWNSVRGSVWNSVWNSVGDSVWNSVRGSVCNSVRDSVWSITFTHISSFFDIRYEYNFSSGAKLWEMGLVPKYEGNTWRLYSGKYIDIVFNISKSELETYN